LIPARTSGNPDHLKVFASPDAADAWLAENDPEGVAFEYDVLDEADVAGGRGD
jgi:hypothetical protein